MNLFFKKNQKGFSLLEVMVAVGILAVMGLAITSVLNRALTSKQVVESRDDLRHAVRITFQKLNDDLMQAFMAGSAFKGKEKLFTTGLKGGEGELEFSTLSHFHYQKDAHDTDQVNVSYQLVSSRDGFSSLVRKETPRLGIKIDDSTPHVTLLTGVKEWTLQYYDPVKAEWVSDWDTESTDNNNRLPRAVSIRLVLVDVKDHSTEEPREYTYSTTVLLDLYKNEISF